MFRLLSPVLPCRLGSAQGHSPFLPHTMHPLHLVSSVHGVVQTYLLKTTLFREVGSHPKSKVINLSFKHFPNFVQILVHDKDPLEEEMATRSSVLV